MKQLELQIGNPFVVSEEKEHQLILLKEEFNSLDCCSIYVKRRKLADRTKLYFEVKTKESSHKDIEEIIRKYFPKACMTSGSYFSGIFTFAED